MFINFNINFCFSKEEVEEFLKHVSVKKEIEEYQSTILSVYIGCIEKVIVLYIFLDNVSCEEFAM